MPSERYKISHVAGVTGSILYTISRCAYICESESVVVSQKTRVIKKAQIFEAVNQVALSVRDIYYFLCGSQCEGVKWQIAVLRKGVRFAMLSS